MPQDGDTPINGQLAGAPAPGAFAERFAPEFYDYYRAQVAQATDQAQAFVEFVGPARGSSVVEVGAGAGRIAFEGGLAERVGSGGRLLVTDASGVQLEVARRRAAELGLTWIRFLRAPAEALPLPSDSVDLVLGANFLHFTQPLPALTEMARVVRPGGAVAVSVILDFEWPPFWMGVLARVWEELRRHGLGDRRLLPSAPEVRQWVRAAGLTIQREAIRGPQFMDYPNVDLSVAIWRQTSMVKLLLRGLPPDRQAAAEEAFEAQIREAFPGSSDAERRLTTSLLEFVARKPD